MPNPAHEVHFQNVAFDYIPSGVVIIEKPDGRITHVNKRAIQLYGTDPGGVAIPSHSEKAHLFKLDGTPYPPRHLPASRSLFDGDVVKGERIIIKRPDGTDIVVSAHSSPIYDEKGEIVAAVGIFEDITKLVSTENLLCFHDTVLSSIQDALIAIDSENNVIFWNRGATLLYGISESGAIGKNLETLYTYEWLDPEDEKAAYRCLERDGFWKGENIHATRKGLKLHVESLVTVVTNNRGEKTGLLAVIRDITKRVEYENELRDLKNALERKLKERMNDLDNANALLSRKIVELEATRTELQNLSQRLIEVQEEERRTIARELHDDIGQYLTILNFALAKAEKTLPADQTIIDARTTLSKVLSKVRNLSSKIRPPMLEEIELGKTLASYVNHFREQTDIDVDIIRAKLRHDINPRVRVGAFRIIQESLTNIARHAGVKKAILRVWEEADNLMIEIADKGSGFNMQNVNQGSGLGGMRERALLLGGEFTVHSAPNRGTRITAALPL